MRRTTVTMVPKNLMANTLDIGEFEVVAGTQ